MTGKQNRGMLLFILAMTVLAAFISIKKLAALLPITRNIRTYYGLDIQGGLRVVLRAKTEEYTKKGNRSWTADNLESVRRIMENRVNSTGVSEPSLITKSPDQIIIELPGIKDPDKAIEQIKSTASLKFYLLPQLGSADGQRPAIWTIASTEDPKTKVKTEILIDINSRQPVSPETLQSEVFDKPELFVAGGEDLG